VQVPPAMDHVFSLVLPQTRNTRVEVVEVHSIIHNSTSSVHKVRPLYVLLLYDISCEYIIITPSFVFKMDVSLCAFHANEFNVAISFSVNSKSKTSKSSLK
jgi:hypothetical protein